MRSRIISKLIDITFTKEYFLKQTEKHKQFLTRHLKWKNYFKSQKWYM